jgi:hypothetical protein
MAFPNPYVGKNARQFHRAGDDLVWGKWNG